MIVHAANRPNFVIFLGKEKDKANHLHLSRLRIYSFISLS
jgi:hypothetical protein